MFSLSVENIIMLTYLCIYELPDMIVHKKNTF